jgi:hypothetical protein
MFGRGSNDVTEGSQSADAIGNTVSVAPKNAIRDLLAIPIGSLPVRQVRLE